jgi:hypothetical protein
MLFLSSGFSLSATNITGNSPPNGKALRRHFINSLDLPSDTAYDLQVLTEEFEQKMMRRGCIEKLYNIFRIAALSPFQAAILNVA